MFDPASVRFEGPLAPYALSFWSDLMRLGYAPLSGRNLLLVAAHVSRWLKRRGLGVGALTAERVVEFTVHRRRLGYTQFLTPRALRALMQHLDRLGVVRAAPSCPSACTPIDRVLREYAVYLARERGLQAPTIQGYLHHVRRFTCAQFGHAVPRWSRLVPEQISRFVLHVAEGWSIGSTKLLVTALRSLLRFLLARGHLRRDLTGSVPAVAGWRMAGLPKALEPGQVARLLRSCNLQTEGGFRDRAILHLLVRLGLRAGEVAALQLDDINWRVAELRVRGKGREARLPLPQDVGVALAAYLRRARPSSASRHVFLWSRAPFSALSSGGVSTVTQHSLRRIGVQAGGAHLLRHTAATQMLRRGASLPEIGHALRHRHIDTTAIYAKVDLGALRMLAQPWIGGVA